MQLDWLVKDFAHSTGFSESDLTQIVSAIRRHLGIQSVESVLGRGTFGIAAALDKDWVLKLTTDPTEIATSYRLVGQKLRHVVHIRGVWLIGGLAYSTFRDGRPDSGHPIAAIIEERMSGTGTRVGAVDTVLTDEMMLARSGHPGRDLASLERRSWDHMLALRVLSEEGGEMARLAQIADGIEELRERSIYVGDVHHKNVGWKMAGGQLVLKIFDLGISSAPPTTQKPPTIEEANEARHYYHGTLVEHLPAIAMHGLVPQPHRDHVSGRDLLPALWLCTTYEIAQRWSYMRAGHWEDDGTHVIAPHTVLRVRGTIATAIDPNTHDPACLITNEFVDPGRIDVRRGGRWIPIGSWRGTQTVEEPVAPTASTPSEPNYVYHATNVERAADIAREGLKPHRPWKFTDQRTWPDGGTETRVYFTPNAGVAWGFAPEEGRPVLLRVPKFVAQSGDGTGDRFSRKRVPAAYIEILTTEGWVPLRPDELVR
jgi:hypothetical protein